MRPTALRQSALRAPLNALLGTEANVRLLRLLTQTGEPISGTQLAREARLSAPGVYQALEGLRAAGIVERLGRGPRGQFRLRAQHPLVPALASLFEAERQRVEQLLDDLRSRARQLSPPPRSVWVFGPVAEQTDAFGDPIDIAMIAGAKQVTVLAEELRGALTEVETRHDVTINVRGLTEADLEGLPRPERALLDGASVILGLPPDAYFKSADSARRPQRGGHRGHEQHDEHLLHLAGRIAAKLKTDATPIDRALRYIHRRARVASAAERKELLEWERLLRSMSLTRLREFLVDRGPQATRLRQTLPFLDVVSTQEREAILRGAPSDPR
jgi:DNA-binding transcriptional ArsR family regulator